MPTLEELEEKFRRLGLDRLAPGFYDSPEFIRAERRDSTLLVNYAQYVKLLVLGADYLARARQIIEDSADFLYRALVLDGRRGACIDVSSALLRFLEQEGVWC